MMKNLRLAFAALALAGLSLAAMPAGAQQPTAVNPTVNAVKEEQLLRALKPGEAIGGRVSIPDGKAANLQRPMNRDWTAFRDGPMRWIGALTILGILAALTAFYLVKGRLKVEGGLSGVKLLRFGTLERFTHWLTAGSFIVLALSGLNLTFGRVVLAPIFGPEAFATLSQWGKYAHNYLAWPFMAGLAIMFLVWVRDNIPNKLDIAWIKAAGGFLGGGHPPAKRFNAGQKVIFWSVILGGAALSVSGLVMLFPFQATAIAGQQIAHLVHGLTGLVLAGIIIAHIYIGSVGMEGAYDAMGSGEVDLAWAREHHSLWAEEELKKLPSSATPLPMAAE
ncbi:MAG TPA: formate dehydrogenase subunit gamma [Beijerinckiaceae bacterium]|jgi:formate dehydrogenase subunit gamma